MNRNGPASLANKDRSAFRFFQRTVICWQRKRYRDGMTDFAMQTCRLLRKCRAKDINDASNTGTRGADYWKSQGRKFCDFCKCWIADNKPSIDFHEGGKKHKENVSKRLKEIHKNSAKQAKQTRKMENDIKKMESAAMAAYLKDLENNTRDMTADRIIKEKLNQIGTKDCSPEIDPCDPTLSRTVASHHSSKPQQPKGENRAQGKSKGGKGKARGKKVVEDDRPSKPVQKLWYEARSPEGYTYYWNIESNESVWEPPEEGYMTFAEQEEEAKEQAIQEELFKQLEKEEAVANMEKLEEQRANAERERLKDMRKVSNAKQAGSGNDENGEEKETEEESRPYRRDYSIPEKSHPYGPWKTVRKIEVKPIDLQLPQQKQVQLPVFEKAEPPPLQRTFKEKTITQIDTGNSDEEEPPATFKKRRIGNKSVRKRLTDD